MPAPMTTFTYDRLDPVYESEEALCRPVNLVAGTYPKGTLLGEVTATPGTWKAYASGNVDGSQVARRILQYACVADGSGNITLGTSAGGGPFGQTRKDAPAYVSGMFRTAELVGLDAGAVTALGRLISGTIASGELRLS